MSGETLITVGTNGVMGATSAIDSVSGWTPNRVNWSTTTRDPGETSTVATGTPGGSAEPSSTEMSTLMSSPTSARVSCTAYTGLTPSGVWYPATRGNRGVHMDARRGPVNS